MSVLLEKNNDFFSNAHVPIDGYKVIDSGFEAYSKNKPSIIVLRIFFS